MLQQNSSTNLVKKTCSQCGKEFVGHHKAVVCEDIECRKQHKRDYENHTRYKNSLLKYPDGSDPYYFVVCAICGFRSPDISSHVQKLHGISNDDYKKKYGSTKSQELCDKVKGEKNPGYNHGGRLSPFSKKFVNYESDEKIEELIKQANKTKNDNNNVTTKIEYYLSRGFSQEDAEKELSNRQSTFSLKVCVEKYGEELGTEIWQERQNKWQETLNSKSDDEKREINLKKLYKNGMVSKMEDELRQLLTEETMFTFDYQLSLQRTDNDKKHFVYDIIYKNKIIEFNGNFWHANPAKYKADDIVKLPRKSILAKDIWAYDQLKYDLAKANGYEIFVVWEEDFMKNKQLVVNQCKNFLTQ